VIAQRVVAVKVDAPAYGGPGQIWVETRVELPDALVAGDAPQPVPRGAVDGQLREAPVGDLVCVGGGRGGGGWVGGRVGGCVGARVCGCVGGKVFVVCRSCTL
jgi:hypothetical protein